MLGGAFGLAGLALGRCSEVGIDQGFVFASNGSVVLGPRSHAANDAGLAQVVGVEAKLARLAALAAQAQSWASAQLAQLASIEAHKTGLAQVAGVEVQFAQVAGVEVPLAQVAGVEAQLAQVAARLAGDLKGGVGRCF
jgi:hypothetical protein